MRVGGAYDSCYVKRPREDQVFRYDILPLVDTSVIYFCEVCGTGNNDPMFITPQDQHHTTRTNYKNHIMHPHFLKINLLATLEVLPLCRSE